MSTADVEPIDVSPAEAPCPPLWKALLLPMLAGGMGWGIRGQYGHETGAMIPGLLVALSLAVLFCPSAGSMQIARIAALTAVGFSFGGSETYGQTIGLTQDPAIRETAYWWGMLGLFIKGGVWIGLGGAFLGMGVSGRQYRPLEMVTLIFVLLAFWFAGTYLLNRPFGKPDLPQIYFSDYWNAQRPDWKPREEYWGGLWFALIALVCYLALFKKDTVARNMGFVGILAGGLGFPVGQSIQAHRHWHSSLKGLDPYVNWWGFMEVTFGLILGLGLGLGLYLHRRRIPPSQVDQNDATLSAVQEFTLLAVQCAALLAWTFLSFDRLDAVADIALTMGIIPLIGIVSGRYWPYLFMFPVLALPITAKTIHDLGYQTHFLSLPSVWVLFGLIPLSLSIFLMWYFLARADRPHSGRSFSRCALVFSVWFYFYLSVAQRQFPWPWKTVNSSTVLESLFTVFALIITFLALFPPARSPDPSASRG